MKRFSFKNIQIFRLSGIFLKIVGAFFILCLIIAFTTLPYRGLHWLGTSLSEIKVKPEVIVLLGGGGMPGESNLIRIWFTKKAAATYPDSRILVATPGDTADHESTLLRMIKELESEGISGSRIITESSGTNTRSQALRAKEKLTTNTSILLITSPENMRRTVLTFRKAGFQNVNALPTFENASEADFTFIDEDLGGQSVLIPDMGKNNQLRYQVWNHLKYEIMVIRELMALLYYRIRGWI